MAGSLPPVFIRVYPHIDPISYPFFIFFFSFQSLCFLKFPFLHIEIPISAYILIMSLRPISVSGFSLSPMKGDSHSHGSPFLFSSSSSSSSILNYAFSSTISLRFRQQRSDKLLIVSASNEIVGTPLTGVVFQPFEELKNDALVVPVSRQVSAARQRYSEDCEAAINEQIKCVIFFFSFFLVLPYCLVINQTIFYLIKFWRELVF